MCKVFLGRRGKQVWEASIVLWVYVCLWLYLAIMAQTVLVNVPIPGPPPLSSLCPHPYHPP